MKICVYTCITGNYDGLSKIYPSQNPNIDFICFTDNQELEYCSGNWNIRSIPNELNYLSKVKQQRIIKACPNRYLQDYDVSLWIDGNISIVSDIYKFLKKYNIEKIPFFTKKHPCRNCIYEEAKKVLQMKKDFPQNVNPQIERYRKEGFPENFGLHETGVILRRHREVCVHVFGNMWAKEIMTFSHRDQLSFDYCRWKTEIQIGHLQIGNLTKDSNFRWRTHGKY